MTDGDTRYKAYDARMDVLEGERAVVATISTDAVDRDREVIIPKGIDTSHYKRNPVVLFAHRYNENPIGACKWIKVIDGKLVAKTLFAKTQMGQECFQLYQQGILKAFSIGFKPHEMGPPSDKEVKGRPDLKNCRNVIRRAELLEYSVVPVPANPEALAMAVSKGFHPPAWLDVRKAEPRIPVSRSAEDMMRAILRAIENMDLAEIAAQVVRDRIDLKRGRV